MTRVGFEPTPSYEDEKTCEAGKLSLESHAIDRSAILPGQHTLGQGPYNSKLKSKEGKHNNKNSFDMTHAPDSLACIVLRTQCSDH